MALTGKLSTELGIHTSSEKFFNFFAKQLHHIQNISDRVHEGKLHHGDDWYHQDSVKHWTYTIDGKVVTCKEKIEASDEQNKFLTLGLFEGDIGHYYKIFKISLQMIDKDDGVAIAKWIVEYEKIDENVEPPHGYLEYLTKVTKDAEEHLLKA